ncbi:hypothetical protein T492DRAFT_989637 [Pavlovales sp. CCMP2436]|nr:hypothetical protein T492DRAFT_989637 [Pavlovales sp. CCMP2436]
MLCVTLLMFIFVIIITMTKTTTTTITIITKQLFLSPTSDKAIQIVHFHFGRAIDKVTVILFEYLIINTVL